MELISKKLKIDPRTFAPVMRITVDLPLEVLPDGVALMGEDELKVILGTKFYELLKK